jgi:hypothetical protein
MSLQHLCVGLILFAAVGFRSIAFAEEPKAPSPEKHRELARLLNIAKKAPQAEYRAQAREALKAQGVPMLHVVFALTLDQWLLERDPIVRYRASAELGASAVVPKRHGAEKDQGDRPDSNG